MKILGIGNALSDILLRLETDYTLDVLNMRKGAMDLVSEEQMITIQKAQSGLTRNQAPGGSVCNTMRALANLGTDSGYIGKVGMDAMGVWYEEAVRQANVLPYFVRGSGISGCCTVLISPDGERTMATFLGPAATLESSEIPDEVLSSYDLVYIEGYLISNEKLFLPVLERADKLGVKVALDLSNFNIVNGFKELLQEVIPRYVHILFSNEPEAEAYTGLPAAEAVRKISEAVEVSVVTIGKEGALVGSGHEVIHVPASGGVPLDTTGAGDHFAAGFLYGQAIGASLGESAKIGSILAGHVIEVVGPQIPKHEWQQIKLKINVILNESL